MISFYVKMLSGQTAILLLLKILFIPTKELSTQQWQEAVIYSWGNRTF